MLSVTGNCSISVTLIFCLILSKRTEVIDWFGLDGTLKDHLVPTLTPVTVFLLAAVLPDHLCHERWTDLDNKVKTLLEKETSQTALI